MKSYINNLKVWVVSVNWKKGFAVLISRIARCFRKTDPGQYILAVFALVVALITKSMSFPDPVTWNSVVWGGLFRAVWLTVIMWTVMYGSWEITQFGKWLSGWAERHKYGKENTY